MHTIYYNSIAIRFVDTIKNALADSKTIAISNIFDIKKFVETLHSNKYDCDISLHGYNINTMYADFLQMYNYIEAAGGIVKNNTDKYLLIKRFGIWDLPKGKIEKKEKPKKAAIREVCEETGLQNVEIKNNLPDTYHIYQQKNRWFLKKTYWYFMETNNNSSLIPQTEEAITAAVWMSKKEANMALTSSYRSLFDILGYIFTI